MWQLNKITYLHLIHTVIHFSYVMFINVHSLDILCLQFCPGNVSDFFLSVVTLRIPCVKWQSWHMLNSCAEMFGISDHDLMFTSKGKKAIEGDADSDDENNDRFILSQVCEQLNCLFF